MKSIILFFLIIISGGIGTGCQSKTQELGTQIEILVPSSVRRLPCFQDLLARKRLVLDVAIEEQGKRIWQERHPASFSEEVEIPTWALDFSHEELFNLVVEIWEIKTPDNQSPVLQGSRVLRKDDLDEEGDDPIRVYLSLKNPNLKDLGGKFGCD